MIKYYSPVNIPMIRSIPKFKNGELVRVIGGVYSLFNKIGRVITINFVGTVSVKIENKQYLLNENFLEKYEFNDYNQEKL